MSSLWTNLGFLIMSENKILYFKVTFRRKFCYSALKLPDICKACFLIFVSQFLHSSLFVYCLLPEQESPLKLICPTILLSPGLSWIAFLPGLAQGTWNLNYTRADIKKAHHFLTLFIFFSAVLGPSVCGLSRWRMGFSCWGTWAPEHQSSVVEAHGGFCTSSTQV